MDCDISYKTDIYTRQEGSVLITTLLILVVVNLLVIGLIQSSVKESKLATFKIVDSEVFHITDSCVHESMRRLSDLTAADTNVLPHVITQTSLNHMLTGGETPAELNKLNNYSYSCTTTYRTVQSVSGDSDGAGGEIGESGGYGAAGDLSPRYYYEIVSTGQGPQNSTNRIVAMLSAEY